MTTHIKQLAEGQLPNTIGDLYVVATDKQAIVKSIVLVNNNLTTETVNLYITKSGSTARRIIPKNVQLIAGYSLEQDLVFTLEAGDKIQGETSIASKVDFIISGVEEYESV